MFSARAKLDLLFLWLLTVVLPLVGDKKLFFSRQRLRGTVLRLDKKTFGAEFCQLHQACGIPLSSGTCLKGRIRFPFLPWKPFFQMIQGGEIVLVKPKKGFPIVIPPTSSARCRRNPSISKATYCGAGTKPTNSFVHAGRIFQCLFPHIGSFFNGLNLSRRYYSNGYDVCPLQKWK